MSVLRSYLTPGLLLVASLVAGCDGTAPPTGPQGARPSLLLSELLPLYCPQEASYTAAAVLDEAGGTVAVRGHEIQVPPGALPGPVRLQITAPAGDILRVEITAGEHEHYQFQRPVRISMDYGRCPGWETKVLSAWYYDALTGAFLENMGGTDDRPARRYRFYTDHLSGYVIAD